MPRRMLVLIALAEFLGMTLWFSATAAAPAVAAEFAMGVSVRAWLTMAVQAGFVGGTLLTAVTNAADAIAARRLFAAGCVIGAIPNAGGALAPSSALAVGGAVIITLAVRDGPHVSASAPFDRHALRMVLQNRGVRLATFGYLGHMWELYAMWTWIAAFASTSLSRGASTSLSARA